MERREDVEDKLHTIQEGEMIPGRCFRGILGMKGLRVHFKKIRRPTRKRWGVLGREGMRSHS